MDFYKNCGYKKYNNRLKYKIKRRSKYHDIEVDNMDTLDGISQPSNKLIDAFPQTDKYFWSSRDWKYDGPASSKMKHKGKNKGINKGNQCGLYIGGFRNVTTLSHQTYFDAIQDIRGYSDFQLVYYYKDNSPKEIIVDESKPMCVVCYSKNSGSGRKIFKACNHGNELCFSCACQLVICPICRGPRRN